MILPDLRYARPESAEQALEELRAHRNARVLAGGQTLLNALKLRVARPEVLVDVSRLPELRELAAEPDGTLRIGAAVTYAELAESALVREHQPVMAAMASRLVDRQVRARGTIGGNACLADPTSNFPPLLVAQAARLRVLGAGGSRDVDAGEFFQGPFRTAVARDELLTDVLVPPLATGDGVGYESVQLGTDSWALARAAALVQANGTITSARIVLGCAPVPVRQRAMEQALLGREPGPHTVAEAAALAGEAFDPPSDVHAGADYRRAMARVCARRAVLGALREAAR